MELPGKLIFGGCFERGIWKMYNHDVLSIMKSVVGMIALLLQYALLPVCIYHFVVSMFGWVKRKEVSADDFKPVNKFAIVVAAHNEEAVVGNIVRNLNAIDYPKELYDVFVIADNCTDSTARIAREYGAQVFERFNNVKKGKGFALEWFFAKLFKMEKQYNAISVFDADNLVSPNYLKEMNKHLCMGHKVIQGYLDSKNPMDSLVSGSYSITYWLNNRLFQLARYYAGLCCAIGGTGFVVSADVLKEIGWGATSLTEDLEFTLKLVLKGQRVYWSHEVRVYDEKPLTMAQSWKQRKRWMQGQSDCACRYTADLFKKAVKERNLVAFDSMLYVIQPLIIVISGIGLLMNLLKFMVFFNLNDLFTAESIWGFSMLLFTTYISIVFILAEGKFTFKVALFYLIFPFYNLTWIPIIIQGFINRNETEWSHTLHTRAIDINEIKELERA